MISGTATNVWWICYFLIVVFVCQYYLIYKARLVLTSEIEQIRVALDSAELSIQDMDKKASEPMQKMQELQQRIGNAERKANDLQSDIRNLQQRIDTVEKNATNSSKLNSLDLDELLIDHEKLENFLSSKISPAEIKSFFTYSTFEAIKLDELEGDNPEVVTHVKKYMIIPPPNAAVKYESNHSAGLQLQHIFQNKTGGYFVESGANDGLHSSKTVQLENALAWTGALIEPDPGNVLLARDKKRNASLIPTCLSTSTKPKLSAFKAGQGVVLDISDSDLIVHCMPLHSILLALDKPSIDFLSLSVGGAELDILKTVPFDKFDIKVIMVNFEKISGGVEALQGFLSSNNYVIFPTIPAEQEKGQWAEFHRIFVKKGSGFKEE